MRAQAQVIAVPLAEGLVTNLDAATIGPRLRLARNVIWNHRLAGAAQRRTLTFGPTFATAAAVTLTDCNSVYGAGESPGGLGDVLGFGRVTSTGKFGAWNGTGAKLTGAITTFNILQGNTSAAVSAYWATQTATYFGHPSVLKIYKTTNGTTHADYAPTNAPAGVTALVVYLDRLWMADTTNKVWFTDPLDDTTIRATSFLQVNDTVTALASCTASDIDLGAGSHLIVGGGHSVFVLDGDPTLGNAVLRRLHGDVGIVGASCLTTTPQGAYFLGTDTQLWWVPPGASQMLPIGEPVRDLLSHADSTGAPTASVGWMSPYLFLFMGSGSQYVWDLRDPQKPTVWGPMDDGLGRTPLGTARVATSGLYAGSHQSNTLMRVSETAAPPVTGRTQALRTGAFAAQGQDVELERVVLTTTRKLAGVAITVTATLPDGTTRALAQTPRVTTTSQSVDKTARTAWALPGGVRGPAFFLDVTLAAATELELQHMDVEVRSIGAVSMTDVV